MCFYKTGMVRQLVEGNRELKALHIPGALVLTHIPVFEKKNHPIKTNYTTQRYYIKRKFAFNKDTARNNFL